MTHSYDQTLIQRMGFADPDQRSPAHDDACIQIATEPERLVRAVRERSRIQRIRCDLEAPLQKGDGKYASTVGFIDAMVTWEEVGKDNCWWPSAMLVEVKTTISGIGDVLRQMNLYREYKKSHRTAESEHRFAAISDYVIWSLDPADTRFTKLLAQQGYTLIAGPLP